MNSLLFRSGVRRAGGAAKPTWAVPKDKLGGPSMRDRAYALENPEYSGFTLWLRALRPYLQKALGDVATTLRGTATGVYTPLRNAWVAHNPDLRSQLVALGTCYAVLTAITMRLNETHQALMDIRALLSLRAAKAYDSLGFWRSSTEEGGCKHQRYATDVGRLERLWDGALEEATRTRSFDTLVAHLKVNHDDVQPVLPPPINWRFNMIPYGADNPDAHTFPTAKADKPLKSFALNFTYNNMANWGDYVDRRDNKAAALRPARQMFTDVMIPGTK
eukprot:GHVU01012707.1.p1 GENE.GHVU01012707.1~~GHVU01012707.1.p1  ORF type:complete len:275 (-),score=43.12 GHVU01012707.1:384-1208(-)